MRDDRRTVERHLIRSGLLLVVLLFLLLLSLTDFRSIRITGEKHYTEQELENLLFPDRWDRNCFVQFLKEHFTSHRSIPFVERYDIQFRTPLDLEVTVYEKEVVGYVRYMSSRMYFDKDGIVVESTDQTLEGIPEILGLEFGSISLYQKLPVPDAKVFNDILNLTGSLQQAGIACDAIEYDRFRNASLIFKDLTVLLGSDEEMELKISTLKDILPKLKGRKGELDLSEYKGNSNRESYIFREKS